MWILLILVVNIHDAYSVSTKIQIPYATEIECEKAAAALTFISKSDDFKVNSICKQNS
jgi:hypothetical protein